MNPVNKDIIAKTNNITTTHQYTLTDISEFGFISIETSELYRIPTINIEEPSTRLKLNSEQLVS